MLFILAMLHEVERRPKSNISNNMGELLNRPCSLLKRPHKHVTQSHDLSKFEFS